MVGTCEACQSHISVTMKRIKCTNCNFMYHSECVGFTGDTATARTHWKCPKCISIERKGGDNSNTPVRIDKTSNIARSAVAHSDISVSECTDVLALKESDTNLISRFGDILDAKLQSIKYEIVEELKTTIFSELKNEIASLSSEFSQLQTSHSDLQTKNDHLKNDLCRLQERVSASEDLVLELRSQFGRQQQQARMNNLEVVGLPQISGESPIELALKISEFAGVELNLGDIDFAHRVQPQKTITGRPRPIVVKLKDRLSKDKILSGLKRKKGICTRDIGIGGTENKIFVNEHLTPENKQLLKAVKTVAKEKAYKFVWVRNCNIFLRKNEESPALHIRHERDLAKIK